MLLSKKVRLLGLKFVEYAIPGNKFKRKANKEDSDRDTN
jgi:hypothetical protein